MDQTDIVVKKKFGFQKFRLSGQTGPVSGRRPLMPYPGYATSSNQLLGMTVDQWLLNK